jgi:hypothetical protein
VLGEGEVVEVGGGVAEDGEGYGKVTKGFLRGGGVADLGDDVVVGYGE